MQDIKALKAENIFVVLSLIMGLFYLVINPPFQAPDEAQHMFKMWGYTQGTLRFKVLQNYTGDVLPLSLIKLSRYEFMRGDTNKKITVNEIKQSLNVKLDKENKAFYTFNPTSYTPVSYFPSFLLLWVMKLLNIAPLVMMYMPKNKQHIRQRVHDCFYEQFCFIKRTGKRHNPLCHKHMINKQKTYLNHTQTK